jgi:glycosyltransferase involved in cell wall biosynthesis
MKAVFLNRYFHPDHSATSQLLADLAFDLAARGRQVAVIASRQLYDDANAQLPRAQTLQGVSIHRVGDSRFGRRNLLGRSFDYLTFCRAAARRIEEIAAPGDLVIAMTDPPMLGSFVAGAVRRRGARLVNWLQDLFPEVAERAGVPLLRGLLAGPLKQRRDAALRSAAANVAVGETMARYLAEHCGVPGARIRAIPNWADGETLRPVPHEANPLRLEWGLQGMFVVGYSGNLGRVHEHGTILAAMRRLKERKDMRFLFVGGGSELARLKEAAERERLDIALFKPYQERGALAHSLGAADVHLCVLRPEFEGLVVPSKFYGIAAAGRPAIYVGDPRGEIARLLADHGCGRAVRTGEGEHLAALLVDYQGDPGRCRREGDAARRLLEASFERKIALARWEKLLEELQERPLPFRPLPD